MRVLKFDINAQRIKKDKDCDFTNLVPGTSGYLKAQFTFSDDWNGCKKAAVFSWMTRECPVPIIGGKCSVPDEVLKDSYFKVRVVGEREGYRITTGGCIVRQEG